MREGKANRRRLECEQQKDAERHKDSDRWDWTIPKVWKGRVFTESLLSHVNNGAAGIEHELIHNFFTLQMSGFDGTLSTSEGRSQKAC